ncbi:MAG: hypothetical protein HC888_07155, partial [Candidatus Competibacteraceae bacterium]|nr:hypothetical protein [Candidatus Competibacteraceae bacterium]
MNVLQGRGERIDAGNIKGRKFQVYTDGIQQWANFRIPKHANSEPEYTDTNISFDLEQHAEGIGLTGWDWAAKRSRWVAFDFDAIIGHADSHEKKLADGELQRVQEIACSIPWVTVRKSTSGNGLHLYVFVDNVPTANHVEHAALARAILGKMSAVTGFDFDTKVDNCGHIMWIWHRKFEKNKSEGLRLISQGETLTDIPLSWRDHIRVTSGSRRKNIPAFINEKKIDWFEELCGQHPRVPL